MRRLRASAALVAALALFSAHPADAASARSTSARKGAEWLVAQQQSNGAFFKSTERVDETAEHLVAVVAGGLDGDPVADALDYIASKGKAGATRGAFTGRIIAGIVAAGADPRDHGNVDYVAILKKQYANGAYDKSQFFDNLLGANGILAAGGKLPSDAVSYIRSNACSSGGFGYDNGCPKGPDVDTTSWAINVLVAAGRAGDDVVADARAWLISQQHDDGGFAFTEDIEQTSSDSTGLALSAIEALGEDATRTPWERPNGNTPIDALRDLQHASGGFRFIAGSKPNGFSTRQAVVGMAKLAYPVPPQVGAVKTPPPKKKDDDPDPVAAPVDETQRSSEPRETAVASASVSIATATPEPSATNEAAGFDAPSADEDDDSSILASPFLWAGIVGAGVGTGVAMWFRRRRSLL